MSVFASVAVMIRFTIASGLGAPSTTTIDVRIVVTAGAVDLAIVNDGVRARADAETAAGSGFGLPGLRERAAHVGGTLEAGPADGRRWAVRASLPLPSQERARADGVEHEG